jgi:hypothetical protein
MRPPSAAALPLSFVDGGMRCRGRFFVGKAVCVLSLLGLVGEGSGEITAPVGAAAVGIGKIVFL